MIYDTRMDAYRWHEFEVDGITKQEMEDGCLIKKEGRWFKRVMINKLYVDITAALKVIKPYTVYKEDIPQDFRKPSFLISFYGQNPSRGINGRLKNKVNVDISYYPEDGDNAKEECWSVGQDLSRELHVTGFKIKNRKLKIEDHVLHFMFDVDYQEYRDGTTAQMRDMIQNTEFKEE